MSLTITPNFIASPDLIVEFAKQHFHLFEERVGDAAHGSVFPFASKFRTLRVHEAFSHRSPIIDLIFDGSKFDPILKNLYEFIQIQWYMPGEYIVPHQDNYDITKIHLITLTSSDVDGLVVQDGDTLVRIPDRAGQKLDFDYHAWHWVDPVQADRFSLVIGE